MKKLAKCLWLAVVAVLFFSIAIFVSCSDGNSGDEKKPSLSLLPAAVTLEVGESVNLTAELSNAEGTVTYESSASEIATVDAEGTVTAVAVGNAVITATCNDLIAECRVTVEEKIEETPVCFISFVPTELTVYGNTPYTFTPQLKSGDEVISGVTFAYTADDTTILKVDGATITGLKNGTATVTISCEYNGQTVTAQVEVEVIDLIYVTIENSFKVVKNEQANIDGISVIVNGESIDAPEGLAFTTENEAIAKIQDGKILGVARGTTKLTVTYGEASAVCDITVFDDSIGSLEELKGMQQDGWYLLSANIDAAKNNDYLLNSFSGVLNGNGYAITNVAHPIINSLTGTLENMAFTGLTDTNITDEAALLIAAIPGGELHNLYIEATVSKSVQAVIVGDLSPAWEGSYVVTDAAVIDNCVVKVSYVGDAKIGAVAGGSWFGANTALTKSILVITDSENVEIMRTDGFSATGSSGTVENCEIYSLTEYKGLTAVPAWIAQMLNAGFIEDADGVPVLESKLYGTISETSLILVSGGEGLLTVNAYKNHQKVAATVEWTSSGSEKVAVENGKLTAKKAGTDAVTITATIKYGDETITLTCSVLVGELTLSGDDWTTIDTPINMKAAFNEEDISGEVTWSVSDDDIATIDADGKLTFTAHGNITVTATYMGISVEYEVVCYDGTIGSLEDMSKMNKTGWYIMTDNIDANSNTGYLFNFTVEGGTSSDFDGLLDGNGYAITNVSHPILNGLYGTIRNIAFTNVTDTNIGDTHALIMRAAAGGEIYNVYIEATLSENTTAWGILTDDITPYWTTGYVIVKATVVRDVVMNISYTGDTKIGAVAGSSWFGGNTALTERVLVITDSENVEIMRMEGFTVAGSSGTVQNCEVYSLTEYKGLAEKKPEWIAQLYEKGFSDDENGIPVLPEKQVQT